MSSKNCCFFIGNLGDAPEYDDTKGAINKKTNKPSGLATFSIAVDRKDMGKDETDWFDIECWGGLAETCAEYLKKGSKVSVMCRVRKDSWKDIETGGNRSKIAFTAKDVQFLSSKTD